MKENQKNNDERLNQKAKKIAVNISERVYCSECNRIKISVRRFKIMCRYNKEIEQKVKAYLIEEFDFKLIKKVYVYYLFGDIFRVSKKCYIIKI